MAKFKQSNIEMRDGQTLILDTAKAKSLGYDGSETFINTTLSGVTPTQDYHMTTKVYVDDAITTATGSLTSDHGDLTGLDDDDHNKYPLITNFESDRATIATNWTDLTDAGDTVLHGHDHDALTNYVAGEHFLEANIDHTSIQNIGTNAHSAIDTHIADGTLHYLEGNIDHDTLLGYVANEHLLPAAIDHDALLNFDSTEHFQESSIDHDNITNNGSTAHSAIDTHLDRLPTPDAGDDGLFLNWDNAGGTYVFATASGGGGGAADMLDLGAIKTSNGTYNGIVIQANVVNAPAVGEVLYQRSDFGFDQATAISGSTNNPVYAMAVSTSTGVTDVLLQGQLCNTAWDWSAGMLWLDTTTSGAMRQTVASGVGQTVQPMAVALSADTVYFFGMVGWGRL